MILTSEEQARDFCGKLTDAAGVERLTLFAEMLAQENAQQNLVSKASLDFVWLRHLADSAQLLQHVPDQTGLWLDLGTGAGFPGLVIAMMQPDRKVMLVESRKKRVDWLSRVAEDLNLMNCYVVGARVEDLDEVKASVISARAFAPLDKLLTLAGRFSTPDTTWLLPKGRSAAKELAEQPRKISALFHVEQSCTDDEAGILLGKGAPEFR